MRVGVDVLVVARLPIWLVVWRVSTISEAAAAAAGARVRGPEMSTEWRDLEGELPMEVYGADECLSQAYNTDVRRRRLVRNLEVGSSAQFPVNLRS